MPVPPQIAAFRDSIARKVAETLGLAVPAEDDVDETETFHDTGRRARRAAGMRPRRARMRATPHPLGQRSLERPEVIAERATQAERLRVAYSRTREEGGTWVSPAVEQGYRDRRAARQRARAGRRAARRG